MTEALDRRRFVEMLAASFLATAFPGCASRVPGKLCEPDIRRSDPNKRLTIDVHAHFFNGSDVQIKGLLRDVISKDNTEVGPIIRRLAGTLKNLVWSLVPGAEREHVALSKVRTALRKCGSPVSVNAEVQADIAGVVSDLRQRAYDDSLRDLRNANLTAMRMEPSFASRQLQLQLETFPEDAEEFFFGTGEMQKIQQGDLGDATGVYNFIFRLGQYRCVNYIDYLRTIGISKAREIDLAVAHILDFDVPLGSDKPTATSISDQIDLMSKLTVLAGGRVHCFAPFDPMKAVLRQTKPTPLDIVRDAIERRGFIGVKIYPPMGFRAYGNSDLADAFWRRNWLPSSIQNVENFGHCLDQELFKLYTWCRDHGVPIMAHTNVSMGASADFEELVGAKYWKMAIDKVPGLRVNFGHFGNTRPGSTGITKNRQFMNLMTAEEGSKGEFLYADSAYFSELLSDRAKLKKALEDLNEIFSSKRPRLFNRLMFGTDWTMSSILGRNVDTYLPDFESVLSSLEAPSIGATDSNRFFGLNASTFLGLGKGDQNRLRIQKFYDRNSVAKPTWMEKVDQLSGEPSVDITALR